MQSSSIFQILYFEIAFIFLLQKDTEQEDMEANEK